MASVRNHRGLVGRLVLAVWLSSIAFSAPASVEASCNPHRATNGNYYYMGVAKALSNITAVRSTIKTYNPYINGTGGFSYSWVMLPGPVNNEWMQIGPYKSGAGPSMTAQWMQPGWTAPRQADFAFPAVGSNHVYEVDTNRVTKLFIARMDDGIYANPILSWTPNSAQIFAEDLNLANQLMGDSSTHERFVSNGVSTDPQWVAFSNMTGSVSASTSHFGSSGSAVSFDVWDKCQ